MVFTTLISTSQLAARLTDPATVVVDCRFKLDDEDWGQREYLARHIPGAAYVHLDRDLSGPKTGRNGRHPLPHPDALVDTFSRLGVARGAQVIAYDQGPGMYASRLWWLLRWMEHDAVAVVDGGFAKWLKEARPAAIGEERRAHAEFAGSANIGAIAGAAEVAARVREPGWCLLDARAPGRYRGEVEPLDTVAGRIPGAANHFFEENLDAAGVFRGPEDLRARLTAAIGGSSPDHVICYCGSGVTACHNLLALEHAGLCGAKLYPGSWSEWCSDPARPVERGAPA